MAENKGKFFSISHVSVAELKPLFGPLIPARWHRLQAPGQSLPFFPYHLYHLSSFLNKQLSIVVFNYNVIASSPLTFLLLTLLGIRNIPSFRATHQQLSTQFESTPSSIYHNRVSHNHSLILELYESKYSECPPLKPQTKTVTLEAATTPTAGTAKIAIIAPIALVRNLPVPVTTCSHVLVNTLHTTGWAQLG